MEFVNPLLPALRPDTHGLLRRTGGLINAVRDIQQDASAGHWYERGIAFKAVGDWLQAALCFNRVVALANAHWRGWLQAGQASAHLNQVEECRAALIGAEMYGRPMREVDFFEFFSSHELDFLFDFLKLQKDVGDRYQSVLALSLVCFYQSNFDDAKAILSQLLVDENSKGTGWVQYFLSRIDFEIGNFENSIAIIQLPLIDEIASNPRVFYSVGRSYVHKLLQIQTANENAAGGRFGALWEYVNYGNDNGDYFLRDGIGGLIDSGIQFLKKAIAIGPVRAEYYFTLGQAEQMLEPRWSGGYREYYIAVQLEPSNNQYIMARLGAIYSWPKNNGDIEDLIAYVEAADICPDDIRFQTVMMRTFYETENYASCLLQFDKIDKHMQREGISREWGEEDAQLKADCIINLGEIPDIHELQVLANAERANLNELFKSSELYYPIA